VARGKWAPALLSGYDWPVLVQPPTVAAKLAQLRELRAQCRRMDPQFDRRENTLVMPESFSSALEMRLAGLRAVGYAREGRSFLMARGESLTRGGHNLVIYWNLACRFLRIEQPAPNHVDFQVSRAKAEEASHMLAARGVAGDFVMICPFAAGLATAKKLNKKWPAFAEFVRRADRTLGLPLLVYPGPGEHAQARELYPAAIMIDGSDMGIYGALLQRATLVVANDTGPAHMAAALGTRLLSVLGPTVAKEWAPWGPKVTVLQRPQFSDQTDWPTADEVIAAAQQQLAAARADRMQA
jgi:heptosyltransferase-2